MKDWRTLVGVAGELAITVGVLLLLFVVWELGFVAVVDSRSQAGDVSALEQQFGGPHRSGPVVPTTTPRASATATVAPATSVVPQEGELFAILRIPRLGGPTWAKPVYQGTSLDLLAKGLGHYTGTQLPGEVGNVAIAGHRAGHGNPLIDIDAIQPGDVMVIETREAYLVYRATRHEIVEPDRLDVLAPVPEHPGETPTERSFTLTSCNPRYGSSQRWIVFASFVERIPHEQGLPAGLLADPATKA